MITSFRLNEHLLKAHRNEMKFKEKTAYTG